jgi:hypothetical protein
MSTADLMRHLESGVRCEVDMTAITVGDQHYEGVFTVEATFSPLIEMLGGKPHRVLIWPRCDHLPLTGQEQLYIPLDLNGGAINDKREAG